MDTDTILDGVLRRELSVAVRKTLDQMPIEEIIENHLMGYMEQAVSENYYLLSGRVADALISAEIDLAEPVKKAVIKALRGEDNFLSFFEFGYTGLSEHVIMTVLTNQTHQIGGKNEEDCNTF